MTIMLNLIIAFCLHHILGYIWSIALIPLRLIGLHLYRIEGVSLRRALKNMEKNNCTIYNEDHPMGWVYGKYFVGYLNEQPNEIEYLIILANLSSYKRLMEVKEEAGNMLTFYWRRGFADDTRYVKERIQWKYNDFRDTELAIRDEILKEYRDNGFCACVISGAPGSGKTFIGKLLSIHLNASYCNTWRMCDPGDYFELLKIASCPTQESPLIIGIDECDELIDEIHNKTIKPHKKSPIEVRRKEDWNGFFDEVAEGFHEGCIFVLTTNRSFKEIDNIDPAYLRKFRFIRFTMH